MVGLAILSVPLWGLSLLVRAGSEHVAFRGYYRRIERQLRAIEARNPPGMDPAVWRDAVGWAQTALANICVTPLGIRNTEMVRVAAELDARVQGEVGAGTLLWFWDRLGRTGPQGRGYNRRHRIRTLAPMLGEALSRGPTPGPRPDDWTRGVQEIAHACEEVYYRSGCDLDNEKGPPDEADRLLDDLGRLLGEAADPGTMTRVLDRLARSSEYGRGRVVQLKSEFPWMPPPELSKAFSP